jgi:uncharacterized protein (DUF362 family)
MDRRQFLKSSMLGGTSALYACGSDAPFAPTPDDVNEYVPPEPNGPASPVALVRTQDRAAGVRKVLELLALPPISQMNVFLKPNFNTADPPPASTHNMTLEELVVQLYDRGANSITLGERTSGNTSQIMDQKGIGELAARLGFGVENYDHFDPGSSRWSYFSDPELHWSDGLFVPAAARDADCVVTTCCLKTHRWASFTMSLKLGVGLLPHEMMSALHADWGDIRTRIAEINLAYQPDLIVMDGVEAFISGGPTEGTLSRPNVMLAGTDRVAIDAAGVAILKKEGCTSISGRIFSQEQIRRAAQLNIGISAPSQVEFVTDDDASREYAGTLEYLLAEG